jgi:hypothetical protein
MRRALSQRGPDAFQRTARETCPQIGARQRKQVLESGFLLQRAVS